MLQGRLGGRHPILRRSPRAATPEWLTVVGYADTSFLKATLVF